MIGTDGMIKNKTRTSNSTSSLWSRAKQRIIFLGQ